MKCKIEINVTGQKLEIICLLSNTKDFTLRMPKVDIHIPLLLIEVKDLKDCSNLLSPLHSGRLGTRRWNYSSKGFYPVTDLMNL